MSSIRIESEKYVSAYDRSAGNSGTAKQFGGDVDVYSSADNGVDGYHIGKTAGGEYLDYTITVTEPGTYQLNARIASAKQFEKKFNVAVNGQEAKFRLKGSTGGWDSWASVEAAETVNLEAGTHTLRVNLEKGGVLLNYVDLVRTGDISSNGGTTTPTPPTGPSTPTTPTGPSTPTPPIGTPNNSQLMRIQAEDYVTFSDKTKGNSGLTYRSDDVDIQAIAGENNGYHLSDIQKGEFLTYEIEVETAGEYQLNARGAAPGRRTRVVKATIGNQKAKFRIGNTGGWESWKTVAGDNTVTLSKGKHTVRLDMLSHDLNFDYFELVPLGGNSGPASPVVLKKVDTKTNNPIEAGLGSQDISGSASTRTVNYRQTVTGITADLDAATVNYGAKTTQGPAANLGLLKVMPLGDSITRGGDSFDVGGYRDDLWKSLTNSGYQVDFVGPNSLGDGNYDKDHAGFGGYKIAELAQLVEDGLIRTYQPDIVLLMAGTNDNIQNDNFPQAVNRLNSLVGDILAESPDTQVFVASPPPSGNVGRRQARLRNHYNSNMIRTEVADKYDNATFVDVFASLTTDDLISDKIHLTKAGNTKVSNAFFNAIEQKYSGGQTSITPAVDKLSQITNVIGSSYDDQLIGNSAANSLIGGNGDDQLTGGAAADKFILSPNSGFDTITDFSVGQDLIVLADGLDYGQISAVTGSNFGYGSGDTVLLNGDERLALLTNVSSTQLGSNSFATTSDSFA